MKKGSYCLFSFRFSQLYCFCLRWTVEFVQVLLESDKKPVKRGGSLFKAMEKSGWLSILMLGLLFNVAKPTDTAQTTGASEPTEQKGEKDPTQTTPPPSEGNTDELFCWL